MIATIAVIGQFSDRSDDSDHKETTFRRSRQKRSLESGSVHVIAMTAAIVELLFFSVIAAIVAIIWKPGFK